MVNGPRLGRLQMGDSLAPDLRKFLQEVVGSHHAAQQGAEWEQVVLGLCCSFPEKGWVELQISPSCLYLCLHKGW